MKYNQDTKRKAKW